MQYFIRAGTTTDYHSHKRIKRKRYIPHQEERGVLKGFLNRLIL